MHVCTGAANCLLDMLLQRWVGFNPGEGPEEGVGLHSLPCFLKGGHQSRKAPRAPVSRGWIPGAEKQGGSRSNLPRVALCSPGLSSHTGLWLPLTAPLKGTVGGWQRGPQLLRAGLLGKDSPEHKDRLVPG